MYNTGTECETASPQTPLARAANCRHKAGPRSPGEMLEPLRAPRGAGRAGGSAGREQAVALGPGRALCSQQTPTARPEGQVGWGRPSGSGAGGLLCPNFLPDEFLPCL